MKKVFWLVGENSGDLHASLIIKRFNQDVRDTQHYGVGGARMQKEGFIPILPFDRFSVMGFVEVIQHLGFFIKVESKIKHILKKDKPDLVILVDYPGLNLRIAKIADDLKIPVLYFICPQFWAWKHKRVFKLKDTVRHVACILPFEKELLDIHNVPCSYVGHPIAEEIEYQLDRDSFAKFFGLNPAKKWIGFFPGSRNTEIERMLPIYLDSIKLFDSDSYEFLFSKARTVSHQNYLDMIHSNGDRMTYVIDGYTYELMKYCDFLILTSGTVTLEAAYIGTPMLIAYKTSQISYEIGRRLVRIKQIGLPNIIMNKNVVPELVQDDVSPQNIFKIANSFLLNPEHMASCKSELANIRAQLGSKRASQQMINLMKEMLKIHV